MDTKEDALKLSKEVLKELLESGTKLDEYYKKFRELRILEDDPSFQAAILQVEHAFFMCVQSVNILKEQLKLLEVATKKKGIV